MLPPDLSRLGPKERRAVQAFLDAVRRELDGQLLLALFGSRARGDAGPDSDVDLLLVTEADPGATRRRVVDLAIRLSVEHEVELNPFVYGRDRWLDMARRRAALWQNVQRDGIFLLQSPRAPESWVAPLSEEESRMADHRPEIAAYMENACQALKTAEAAFGQGEDYRVVANRAYYAIFYAANAMLATLGLQRSKHTGVIAAFRERFVKTGEIEASFGDDYEKAVEKRHLADYDPMTPVGAEDVRPGLEAARRFVPRIERYLIERGFFAA